MLAFGETSAPLAQPLGVGLLDAGQQRAPGIRACLDQRQHFGESAPPLVPVLRLVPLTQRLTEESGMHLVDLGLLVAVVFETLGVADVEVLVPGVAIPRATALPQLRVLLLQLGDAAVALLHLHAPLAIRSRLGHRPSSGPARAMRTMPVVSQLLPGGCSTCGPFASRFLQRRSSLSSLAFNFSTSASACSARALHSLRSIRQGLGSVSSA